MASFTTHGKTLLSKFRPNLGNRWKSISEYFMRIVQDYQNSLQDAVTDMKNSPRKTAVYLSLLGAGTLLAKTNPSEQSFQEQVFHSHHDLLLLGDRIRNQHADTHVRFLQDRSREGTLRYTNCGFFSLMWLGDFDPAVDTFEARCKLVRRRWSEFHKQIVDVGALGRWYRLDKAMVDYDVNVDEWDENGCRKEPSPATLYARL